MDGMGWDGMGWDGMGWDRMGWDRIGKLYLHTMILIFTKPVQIITAYVFKIYDAWMGGYFIE